MRRPAEKWPPDRSNWSVGFRKWFRRKVKATLLSLRDGGSAPWHVRQALADRKVFRRVTRWYCKRLRWFCFNVDPDVVWESDWAHDQRIQYNRELVIREAPRVVARVQNKLACIRESHAYGSVDAWLEALLAGELEWSGPSEPSGYTMVHNADTFVHAAFIRQKHWPRACKGCGEEFRPDRANAKNCVDCRAKRRGRLRLT